MPIDTSCRFRLMFDNLLENANAITYSSELTGFDGDNILTNHRTEVWKPSGRFTVDSTNYQIYINDGSDKTISLTEADYTASTLATHIQTQLNASSSGFTVSYSSSLFKFTISRTTSFNLRLATTTNAAWTLLGYMSGSDLTTITSAVADEQRNHYPSETITIDFGYAANIGFIALVGDLENDFTISSSATIQVKANSVASFSSPSISKTMTRTTDGAFLFIDDAVSYYRHWEITITDIYNPLGNSGIEIGNIFFSEYETLDTEERNFNNSFNEQIVDSSVISFSENGSLYADQKSKYSTFGNLSVSFIKEADLNIIKSGFNKNGLTKPFFIALDPDNKLKSNINDYTKMVYFTSEPVYTHLFKTYYSVSLPIREAL